MIQLAETGVTRMVLLTKRHAIKLPRINFGWAMFLRALLSNIEEWRFTPLAHHFKLCPTLWRVPGRWLNVQPRCRPLTDDEWCRVVMTQDIDDQSWNGLTCDFKRENFGVLNGQIVLLDYGELS